MNADFPPALRQNLRQNLAMPSIRKRGTKWRAEVYKNGLRESDTFRTKQEAVQWALQREAELGGGKLPDHSFGDALKRYAKDVAPSHRGAKWELVRLASLQAEKIAKRPLAKLAAPDFVEWREARLKDVSPGTVSREMTLMRSVLRIAWKEWHWLRANPMADVKPPRTPPSRKRRITDEEVERVVIATGLSDGLTAETAMNRVGLAFLFALETAMRAGEIMGITWPDVGDKSVRLPKTKNGDERRVPLSPRAREILATLPRTDRPAFDLLPGTRDVFWRRAVSDTKIPDLHFHDSRAEAIWRLSKKLDVMELARVIGHRDLKSLLIYYQTSADELADRL